MADLTIPKGDKGYYINFTVTDSDDDAYDLTDYTITLKVWDPNEPTMLLTSGSCTIVVAASGTCRYLVTANDFITQGLFNIELELTKTGVIESTKTYTVLVEESG